MTLPLTGIRIIAIEQYGAGPFATMHLADMGAEIIKIEDPTAGGDMSRGVPPYAIEGDSLFYQSLNRNKKSVTLNLRSSEGYEAFLDLVKVSDAVLNNLRGDQPARLRIDYASLRGVNPRVVCCSLSGFGVKGPRAADPGFDYLVQAEAGYMALTGDPGGPPTKSGVSVVDFSTGYSAAVALLTGLVQTLRTGVGCDMQVSLLDTALSMLNYLAAWHLNEGYQPQRLADSSHPSLVPSQAFPTRDGYMMVMCNKEHFWPKLCERLGAPELRDDPRFATFAGRLEHREQVIPLLKERFSRRTTAEWIEHLSGHVPVAPIPDFATALSDVFAWAPDRVISVEHPIFGTVRQIACPLRVEGEELHYVRAPSLGEHTEEVLRGCLGYSGEKIDSLRKGGAI